MDRKSGGLFFALYFLERALVIITKEKKIIQRYKFTFQRLGRKRDFKFSSNSYI
jgi:hypothetical protein